MYVVSIAISSNDFVKRLEKYLKLKYGQDAISLQVDSELNETIVHYDAKYSMNTDINLLVCKLVVQAYWAGWEDCK